MAEHLDWIMTGLGAFGTLALLVFYRDKFFYSRIEDIEKEMHRTMQSAVNKQDFNHGFDQLSGRLTEIEKRWHRSIDDLNKRLDNFLHMFSKDDRGAH